MSKIGVGIGEDFPVDDPDSKRAQSERSGAEQGGSEDGDRAEFEAWKRRRDAERHSQEDMRRRREEWDAKKRAFKDKIKSAVHDSLGDDRNWHRYGSVYAWRPSFWPIGAFGLGIALLVLAVPILLIVLVFSLISAAFQAPFLILAIFAILAAVLLHRRDRYAGRYRYYTDDDIQMPPRPSAPPPPRGPTVTPPPSEQ